MWAFVDVLKRPNEVSGKNLNINRTNSPVAFNNPSLMSLFFQVPLQHNYNCCAIGTFFSLTVPWSFLMCNSAKLLIETPSLSHPAKQSRLGGLYFTSMAVSARDRFPLA